MAQNLIELIKVLRDRTGAGLMDCKGALLANDCDLEKAHDWLREKGLAKAAKKASRIAAEGLAVVRTCDCCGRVIVLEVNCETDFVSKGDAFRELVEASADLILKNNCTTVEEAKAVTEPLFVDATVKMGEKFDLRRFIILEKDEGQLIGSYIHNGGKIAVAVKINKEDAELAKQLAMHIAANNPTYLKETDKDFEYLNDLPGKKLMLKGNHDYWWTTLNKMNNYIKQSATCYTDLMFRAIKGICFIVGSVYQYNLIYNCIALKLQSQYSIVCSK